MTYKLFRRTLGVVVLTLVLFCQTSVNAQKVIKILAIGNSFSEDATEAYLGGLISQNGTKYIIGNLFIGGCSLQTHWTNAEGNLPKYSYRKIIDGKRTVYPDRTMLSCIKEEKWDYITFQQASPLSGQQNSYFPYLSNLFQYVKANALNPKVKYAMHQTWAYAKTSTHTGFNYYNRNQQAMYDSIVVAINKAAHKMGIMIIIPSGTAIQNGRTSYVGDKFNRDGYHLSYDLGRYTAACTWFETLFGKSVIGNAYAPEKLTKEQVEIAQMAAHAAVKKPNSVTPFTVINAKLSDIYGNTYVRSIMASVFKWQVQHPIAINEFKEQWARSVFYSGIMYAYRATGDTSYLNQTQRWGEVSGWKRGPKFRHADDLACGQAYLDAYAVVKDPKMLNGIKSAIDTLIANPKPGRKDWWWCDALFMEPPVLARLGKITGDNKYYEYLDQMYWDTSDYLYSKSDSLYFRDSRYFTALTRKGKRAFWSRGNAWVIGGLVQILTTMPKEYPGYKRFEDHYREIMVKVASLQQTDGLWRASLLDPDEVPVRETSGSSFFTYAMAWGINNGILDRETFLPKVKKGWQAINEAVDADGKLKYVQLIGEKPENVKPEDNQEYGSGAFLMAGAEMIKIACNNNLKK
ncbi:MAG: DUF4886 domain-containing protein [Bacteroidota bacterium]|nr:DUF4886 domain-containing protein [Bacteroidota bacterium]